MPRWIRQLTLLALGALLAACAVGPAPRPTPGPGPAPAAPSPGGRWVVERVVEGSPFKGVHGLGIDHAGNLFAGSVVGQSVYAVDRQSGAVRTLIGPPGGMADDIAFAPDGTMAWTSFLLGDISARRGDGPVRRLASGLPGINSLAYRADGRLYATQVFLGDALYDIDTQGVRPPRKIMEGMGGLNGFQFGSDGKLYGPLWFKGQVVRVDVDTARIEVLADGFKIPAAVNLDSKGNLWVVDTARGQLVRIDPATRAKTVVAQLSTSLDNLVIDRNDRIFVSNMADNGIQEVDPATGQWRQVVKGRLAVPGGLAVLPGPEGDEIHIADLFAYRKVNARTGRVTDLARMHADTLEYPFSATGNARHVVLSSWFTGTVQVLDRASGRSLAMVHGLQAPHDALSMPDGSLIVAELGTGSLVQLSGPEYKSKRVLAKGLAAPVGLVAAKGGFYVTESASGVVSRVEADGRTQPIAKGLRLPEGIALAPDGRLIVVEAGAQRIVSIDPGSGAVSVIAERLPIGVAGVPGVPPSFIPTGVGVGSDGTIYFSSDVENALYRIVRR